MQERTIISVTNLYFQQAGFTRPVYKWRAAPGVP